MRRGFTAVELMIASAVLLCVSLPIFDLLRSSQQGASLDELQVQARRRGLQALALLDGHRLDDLLAAAIGPAPPAGLDPRLSAESREIYLPLPPGGVDPTLDDLPAPLLRDYLGRAADQPVDVYLELLEPGFARLTALVRWSDPLSHTPRHLVLFRFVQDPFHWRATL